MDWEMIIVFTILSIFVGALIGLFNKSLIVGLFFIALFMGLVVTAALVLVTGYDGFFVWIAGPLITLGLFHIILKIKYIKYPDKLKDKLKELDQKLGFKE